MKPLVICGPTASGKTELALEIARRLDGIILSADSRQVYKRLTTGTAKPKGLWQNGIYTVNNIPYYLVDFLDVTDTFNAGAFCTRIKQIATENPTKPLIFAGGTGLYLHAYFVGLDELPRSTPQTRATLENLLQQEGKEGLYRALQKKDPASATQIPVGNVQRVMRALELCLLTGRPASQLKSGRFFQLPSSTQSSWIYLDWSKEMLHRRIQQRSTQMFDGMAQETQTLLNEGYLPSIPALKSLGYPQIISYLQGRLSRKKALEEIILRTRQYAKRQRTWFNRYTQASRITLNQPEDFDTDRLAGEIIKHLQ